MFPRMLASRGLLGAPDPPMVQGLWRAYWGSLGGGNSFSQGGGQRRLRGSLGQGLDARHQGSRSLPKDFQALPLSDQSAAWMMVS